jgi:arylesterase / paraoxonase
VLGENEILVTNDHYFRRRFWPTMAILETYLAYRGGKVTWVKWNPTGDVETKKLTRLPFANGIALIDSKTVAVASSSMNSVYLYTLNTYPGSPPSLSQTKTISLPYHPDNLSVDGKGKLLIAGHPHGPTLAKVAVNNRFCQEQWVKDKPECQARAPTWVSEWSEAEGLKTLYVGFEYGSGTTAVRDVKRKIGVVSGLYEKGLFVWES